MNIFHDTSKLFIKHHINFLKNVYEIMDENVSIDNKSSNEKNENVVDNKSSNEDLTKWKAEAVTEINKVLKTYKDIYDNFLVEYEKKEKEVSNVGVINILDNIIQSKIVTHNKNNQLDSKFTNFTNFIEFILAQQDKIDSLTQQVSDLTEMRIDDDDTSNLNLDI
jgi:hypothetical protein